MTVRPFGVALFAACVGVGAMRAQTPAPAPPGAQPTVRVEINAAAPHQVMEGFGASTVSLIYQNGADDKLPRAYRVTYLDDPQRLRQSVVFSKWVLDGSVDGDAFTSAKAAAAKQIAFARPDPQVPQALLDEIKAQDAAKAAKKKSK